MKQQQVMQNGLPQIIEKDLIQKYNTQGPRYTSYPTVPYWDKTPSVNQWKSLVKETFHSTHKKEGIALYIHLPFCESLCTYCGCNTRITVNHKVELPYIESLLKEWSLYLDLFDEKPVVSEIHLGGGTPTFFSAKNLAFLLLSILKTVELAGKYEFSFEAHPANTTIEHLSTLFQLGFDRLSLGIQDFDIDVQKMIHRFQTFDEVNACVKNARSIGYTSINFDLIYGLPLQSLDTIKDTISKVELLNPDRIAFYSYAHVPWLKPGQRKYTEEHLPKGIAKQQLYDLGKEMLTQMGYVDIGLDHFALPSDELYHSQQKGKLHRNFMGYTATHTSLMIGLGVSSISDSWTGFTQNIKVVEEYQKVVSQGDFPFFKGHVLNEEDLIIRKIILDLMCNFKAKINTENQSVINDIMPQLLPFIQDELLEINSEVIVVTEIGKPFVRNVCMAFDLRLMRNKPQEEVFSKTV